MLRIALRLNRFFWGALLVNYIIALALASAGNL